jgi:hypothetical protein
MLNFPDWSDLGGVSSEMRLAWEQETSLRRHYRYYYDGLVFKEKVPMEAGADESEAPLMYPVGINLVKMLALAQTDSLFGEWEDQIVKFEVRQDDVPDAASEAAISLLGKIVLGSELNSALWEVELDRNVYGGGAFKVSPALKTPGFVKWSRIPLENFFPIFDPEDPNQMLEVYSVLQMTPEMARLKYGYEASVEIVTRVEHWTPFAYENWLDGRRIDAYSGVNPWGFVPFVYIPRLRSNNWFGDALTEDIIQSQDELNGRLADTGDAINYNAHPVKWGINLPKAFNTRNFPVGPNAMWDAGRQIGTNPPPQISLLEAKNPVPQGLFDYITFLYDWSRTSSFSPPIAFGEDNGGGQRSGATLEIRMWPLVKAVRRSRSYLSEGLMRMVKMSGQILQQKKLPGIPARALERMIDGSLVARFAEVMPRDHQAIVDEVVKLLTTTPPTHSLETATKLLGRGPGEVERIRQMVKDKDFFPDGFNKKPEPSMNAGPGKSGDVKEGIQGKTAPQTRTRSSE